MKLYSVIILILVLISCNKSNDNDVSKSTIIKKERIIRYKLLPNNSQLIPPFSEDKNREEIFYEYFSLDTSSSLKLPVLFQFQGYKIIETSFEGDTIKEYSYNRFANLTETKITISNDSMLFSREITSSTNVQFTTVTLTSNKIKKELTEYYDPIIKSISHCGMYNDNVWERISILDSNNNPINIKSKWGDQTFKYDTNGQIIYYENIYGPEDEFKDYGISIYDSNNRLIEEKSYGDKPAYRSTILYQYRNDTLIQTSKYDSENNLKWSKSTEFKYDSLGNWIKKVESINSTPRFITLREITYY